MVEDWGRDRIGPLAELVAAVAPDEEIHADEIVAALYDDPGVVVGTADGTAAAAASVRPGRAGGHPLGVVKLLAVHPAARRQGHGRALLAALEARLAAAGVSRIATSGSSFWLWPGVPAPPAATEALLTSSGYEVAGETRRVRMAPTLWAEPPAGTVVRRAITDEDLALVAVAVARHRPDWSDEVARATEHGTCHVAVTADAQDPDGRDGEAVGLVCHSVNRAGWVGPLAVVGSHRGLGVGRALMARACRDLMVADFTEVVVPMVGDDGFFARLGAEPAGRDLTYARQL